MVIASGMLYWLGNFIDSHGLVENGEPIGTGFKGWLTAIYFSFVTATSVGYGDVQPQGLARVFAVIEAVSGLLIFGAVVAKFVSRRQDEMVREIHRVTFEERLDRVQTNLHLVISELQSIGGAMRQPRRAAGSNGVAIRKRGAGFRGRAARDPSAIVSASQCGARTGPRGDPCQHLFSSQRPGRVDRLHTQRSRAVGAARPGAHIYHLFGGRDLRRLRTARIRARLAAPVDRIASRPPRDEFIDLPVTFSLPKDRASTSSARSARYASA